MMRKDDDTKLPSYTVSSEKTVVRFVDCTVRHGVRISGNRSVFYLLVNKGMLQIELRNSWTLGFYRASGHLLRPLR